MPLHVPSEKSNGRICDGAVETRREDLREERV